VLCEKNRPLFAQDEAIKRLPEIALTPFLKQLKEDAINKAKYLSVIRITTQIIAPCPCYLTHTYCATAFILQKKQTHCFGCKEPF
jgi:hypothetical protein